LGFEPSLGHFLEKFLFASARTIAMHFTVWHSTIKDILSWELGLQKFSRRCVSYQLSDSSKKLRINTPVELLALLDQYSTLQIKGIATGDKLWAC
jgi:hypothetical protein